MPNVTERLRAAAARARGMERKKLLLACLIVVVAALLVLAIATTAIIATQQRPTPTADIVVQGKVACLPHKNTSGPQTLECALGLRTSDNRYYALQTAPGTLPAVGTNIEVHGTLAQPETASQYDIVGTIGVTTVRKN